MSFCLLQLLFPSELDHIFKRAILLRSLSLSVSFPLLQFFANWLSKLGNLLPFDICTVYVCVCLSVREGIPQYLLFLLLPRERVYWL